MSWSKLGAWTELGASWSELGAGSELEQADFGPVVGTYKGLLRLCEWTLDGDFTSRWWGHISRICHNGSFSATGGVGVLKPSITFHSLGLLQLAPSSLQLAPTLPHSPLHSTGGGDPNTYMAIESKLE